MSGTIQPSHEVIIEFLISLKFLRPPKLVPLPTQIQNTRSSPNLEELDININVRSYGMK